MKYLISFLLLLATPAAAGPDRLSVLFGSHHVNATEEFNEINPGIIFTWERRFDWSAGVYYNSYEQISPMAVVGYNWTVAEDLEIGLFAGTAYYGSDADTFAASAGGFVPLGGAQLRYKNFFTQFIPAGGETVDAVISFGMTWEIK